MYLVVECHHEEKGAWMRICLETLNVARRGFEELSLSQLAISTPWSWRALLQNVDAQVEVSMTLIQLPEHWPRPTRRRRRGVGLNARPVCIEGGRWQRVIEHASFDL